MSKRKSGGHAAESPYPPELVCILVVDAIIDEFEVEICCQRTGGVDRVFSTSMDWLSAERPSDELDEFVAQRRSTAAGFIGGRTLH